MSQTADCLSLLGAVGVMVLIQVDTVEMPLGRMEEGVQQGPLILKEVSSN